MLCLLGHTGNSIGSSMVSVFYSVPLQGLQWLVVGIVRFQARVRPPSARHWAAERRLRFPDLLLG